MLRYYFTVGYFVGVSVFLLTLQTFAQNAGDPFSSADIAPVASMTPIAPTGSFEGDDPFLTQRNNRVANNAVPNFAAQNMQTAPRTTPPPFVNSGDAFREIQPEMPQGVNRERIQQLATQNQNGPDYLKPLNPWNGPFKERQRKKNLEQDLIQQVNFNQISNAIINNEPVFDWEKTEEKGFDWSSLDPAKFVTKVRDWMGMGPDEKKARAAMDKGREILLSNPGLKDQKKCVEAAKHFGEAAKRFPDSVIEEDALHLAGECYFFADDYPHAMTMYQNLLMKYQHSKHLDNDVRRLFKIARYWEAEAERGVSNFNFTDKSRPKYDTFGFAKKCYEAIFINDPNGPISDDAVMALATAYLARGKYQGDDNYNQAAYYYQYLRENFPLSRHLAKAHENELFARTHAYLGADHPSKSLEEAGKLADITLKQFGSELQSEEKEEIIGIKEGVLNLKAEQLWVIAQFWDIKKRQYGSAKLYYEQIMREYPQTEFAEKARQRMEAIKNLPDTPSLFNFSSPINWFKGMTKN